MKKKINIKNVFSGFSLAEALIVLLIVAIIVAISAPMITKRRKSLRENAVHGKWACKYIDGTLHSATAENVDDPLPDDSEWEKDCKFPSIAKNVKYLWVEVYGGGGGGARGYATPWISKTYSYDLGTPAPRDGEYDITASVSNRGYSMSWKNENNLNADGIYYSNDPDTRTVCNGRYFGEYEKQDDVLTYANCKTYTAKDVCIYTGDSSAIKRDDCISSVERAGTYCYRNVGEVPPSYYNLPEQLLARCKASGYENCTVNPNSVTYTKTKQKCLNTRSLPYVYYGSSAPGISGKVYLKEGEYLKFKVDNQGEYYPSGNLGGYEHYSANDGDDYALYHHKSEIQDGVMHVGEKLVAKMSGGKAGIFTETTSKSSRCCTNCGKLDKYPNSSKTSTVFCAKDGENGKTTLSDDYSYLKKNSSTSKSQMSILNQDFEYYNGCSGANGSYSANLFPASRNHNYEIKVGKGGNGATGEDDNTVSKSAQDGKDSYFGWIRGAGGKGAGDYCKTSTVQEQETNIYNSSTGGKGGSVEFPDGKIPQRNYALTIEEDKYPNSRWTVTDGQNGKSGIIVVSW